ELDDFLWLKKLGFLTDVTLKLKTLNLSLQEKNLNIVNMISIVNAFKFKLSFWIDQLKENNLTHFSNLKLICNNFDDIEEINFFIPYLETLSKEFDSRFAEFKILEPVASYFLNPFALLEDGIVLKICEYFNFHDKISEIEMEIIDLKEDLI
ncbi:General transcription factor II-I repeat domain-containing protein 2B, partial [Dictyocoela muelleri]